MLHTLNQFCIPVLLSMSLQSFELISKYQVLSKVEYMQEFSVYLGINSNFWVHSKISLF